MQTVELADNSIVNVDVVRGDPIPFPCFRNNGEVSSIWDRDETAALMAAVIKLPSCVALKASYPCGMVDVDVGFAFLLLNGPLPPDAYGILGIDQVRIPRVIVLVHPTCRDQGLGSALLQLVETELRARTLRFLEVEAEQQHEAFFEARGFRRVQGAVRDYCGRRMYLFCRHL